MVLRVVLFTGVALSLMSVIANGSLARRVGASAGCSIVRVSGPAEVEACHSGWFKSSPNLSAKGCTTMGATPGRQLWSCPVYLGR